MSITMGRFSEICQLGDRFLLERFGLVVGPGCRKGFTVPDRADFYRALDDFGYQEGVMQWTPIEVTVLHNYTEAAIGLRPVMSEDGEREAWWQR